MCYPGHGEPIEEPAARAREIIEHHRERLDVVVAALADGPRSGYEVSNAVFGAELRPSSAVSPSPKRCRISSGSSARAAPRAPGTPET